MSKVIPFRASNSEIAALDWLVSSGKETSVGAFLRRIIRQHLFVAMDVPKELIERLRTDRLFSRDSKRRRVRNTNKVDPLPKEEPPLFVSVESKKSLPRNTKKVKRSKRKVRAK